MNRRAKYWPEAVFVRGGGGGGGGGGLGLGLIVAYVKYLFLSLSSNMYRQVQYKNTCTTFL